MNRWRIFGRLLVMTACFGMVLPPALVEGAGPPVVQSKAASLAVADVVLDSEGGLRGLVVDLHGAPRADEDVGLVKKDGTVVRVRTDRLGRYRVAGLKGGAYLLQAGGQGRLLRAWTADSAPPSAKSVALMVVGSDVVRGQMPLEEFFASDGLIIAGLVAAAIAIPIAVHNQGGGHDEPASP